MIQIRERVGKMLEYLEGQIYPAQVPVESWKMIRTDEKFQDVEHLDTAGWADFSRE